MIGEKFNYDDVFFRDLTICTLAMLEDRFVWYNRFSDEVKQVNVPFYYSLTGKEDFLLDSFTDDIVGQDRKLELNSDVIPRGHITLNSWRYKEDEMANVNQWVRMTKEEANEIKKVLTKIRPIPITASYNCKIIVNNENSVWKASESYMNNLLFFRFMYFEFNFIKIDASVNFSNEKSITINREYSMEDTDLISIEFDMDVHTYYPAFVEEQEFGRPRKSKWLNKLTEARNNEITREQFIERQKGKLE